MKSIKFLNLFNGIAASILIAALFATACSAVTEVPFVVPFTGSMALAIGTSVYSHFNPSLKIRGSFFAEVVYRQAWDKQLIKRFDDADNNAWRAGIRDISSYFSMLQDGEVVVVNLSYFGVSPDVLIDNTAYPIAIQTLEAENLVVTVKKFQTKATPITDDELFGLNYQKMATVQESHVIKIQEEKNNLGLHSIGCTTNTAATPVLLTTGDLVGGRRMLIKKDLLTLRDALNKLKVPREGRRLVLCNDHINDLLQVDQKFMDQYHNYATGQIYKTLNFEFYESNTNPYYHVGTKAKLAYGGVVTGNHTEASLFFHVNRVLQGKGFTKNYLSPAAQDPLNQRNLYNVRTYDMVLPYKQEGIGAIASAIA